MTDLTYLIVMQDVKQIYPDWFAQIESALRHCLLPQLGFSSVSARATKKELSILESQMASRPFPHFSRVQWERLIDQGLQGRQKDAQRSVRSYLRRYVDALEQLEYLLKDDLNSANSIKPRVLRSFQPKLVADKSYLQQNKTKRHYQDQITLSFKSVDYLDDYQKLYPDFPEIERLQVIEDQLNRIKQENHDLSHYLTHQDGFRLRKSTLKADLKRIHQLLGYQYSLVKDLSNVGISKIISVVDNNVRYEDFDDMNSYYLAKGKIDSISNRDADKTINFIRHFFNNYGCHYKQSTKENYINSLVLCAKYLYRDIKHSMQYPNYDDITVIKKLHFLKKTIPKDPEKIETLPFNWNEAIQMVNELKERADEHHFYYPRKDRNNKICKRKRPKHQVAIDMQRLLALLLIITIPPIRRGSLAILELGTTLKHGLYSNEGFKPKEFLSDPSEARFYYHFQADQYKTGKFYGEFIAELPNYKFDDGMTFYDYLNKWFYGGYRNYLLKHKQEHQLMFVRTTRYQDYKVGDPISEDGFTTIINCVTRRYFNVEVSPQIFRKIYRTYLINIGATPQELAAAAFFMQHSEKMAQRIYTVQTVQEKINPILNLIHRINTN